jgi:hypothetical protein
MKYTIQRPAGIWLETVVDEADSLEQAIEIADRQLANGDYIELEQTWTIDEDRIWTQDETGKITYELGEDN